MALSAHVEQVDQVYSEAVVAPPGPSALSPLVAPTNPVAQSVGALTSPGLLEPGRSGQPTLALAASWRIEAGGAKYAFTLSPKRKWSDGAPITTRDVAFTLAVLQSPQFPNTDLAAPWTGVSLDASSLWAGVFTLPGPSTSFPAAAEDAIIPAGHYHDQVARYFKGGQRTVSLFPPSAGPFTVAANTPNAVRLTRNPYYRPRPRLAGFRLDLEPTSATVKGMLAAGTVDGWLASTPSDLAGLPSDLVASRMTTYAFVELILNEQAYPLDTMAVRQAIASAINRGRLLSHALHGLGRAQYGPLPVSIGWARAVAQPPASTVTPAQLLKAAGWTRTRPGGAFMKSRVPLKLTIDVPQVDPLPAAAAGLAAQLGKQGILATVRTLPQGGFVSTTLTSERFQAALVGFDNGPDPDLTALFLSGVEPGQSLNFSQAAPDPFLNHALDQLATAANLGARRSAYRTVSGRLSTDIPAVFLYTPVDVYYHLAGVHTPGVPSVGDPAQRFADVAAWRL